MYTISEYDAGFRRIWDWIHAMTTQRLAENTRRAAQAFGDFSKALEIWETKQYHAEIQGLWLI